MPTVLGGKERYYLCQLTISMVFSEFEDIFHPRVWAVRIIEHYSIEGLNAIGNNKFGKL